MFPCNFEKRHFIPIVRYRKYADELPIVSVKECIAAQVIHFVKGKCFHFFCFFRAEMFTEKNFFS